MFKIKVGEKRLMSKIHISLAFTNWIYKIYIWNWAIQCSIGWIVNFQIWQELKFEINISHHISKASSIKLTTELIPHPCELLFLWTSTWIAKVLSPNPGVIPNWLIYDASLMKFSIPWKTPRPVAEIRPWIPPWLIGFPVTQAWALISCKKIKKFRLFYGNRLVKTIVEIQHANNPS